MATEPQPEPVDALAQISGRVQVAFERQARQHNLSATLARLLDVLDDRAPAMSELADRLGLDKSSTSGLVDRAQRRGLVRRVPSQLDRRSVRVRLTIEGRELRRQMLAAFAQDLGAMLEPLSPADLDALTSSLRHLLIG